MTFMKPSQLRGVGIEMNGFLKLVKVINGLHGLLLIAKRVERVVDKRRKLKEKESLQCKEHSKW